MLNDQFRLANHPTTVIISAMTQIFIGDRPAQMCALVLDEPTRYTGDKLDPFAVHKLVERYVTDNNKPDYATVAHHAYRVTQRHIVLSTGLTWAPKYDGMAAKQINTLLQESFVTPIIYVLPVSTRILLGHAINAKLAALCASSQSRRSYTRFLGHNPHTYMPGFAGDAAYPTQPTPQEVLDMLQVIEVLTQS